MREILLVLSLTLLFVGCNKYDELKMSEVEIGGSNVEIGYDYIKMTVDYSYPIKLNAVSLSISENDDMTDVVIYNCKVENDKFSVEVGKLKPNTDYYYLYTFYNGYNNTKSEKECFTTLKLLPTIITNPISDITQTSATTGGVIKDTLGIIVTNRGVCWSTSSDPDLDDNHTDDGPGTGEFISVIAGLSANTSYYVRAYAASADDISYGETVHFNTLEESDVIPPTVITYDVTNITHNSATFNANVADDGGASITERGFCWSVDPNPEIYDNIIKVNEGIGEYTTDVIDLNAETVYYVRAYAKNDKDIAYGEQVCFVTLKDNGVTSPTIITKDVIDITTYSATCGGIITNDGGVVITAKGVCWSTSPNPEISNNHTNNGSGNDEFICSITGLKANTSYYVRAYAKYEENTVYGDLICFTTESGIGEINGYQYVDLGLPSGLKWATCNVGTTSSEDSGDYFAWGETQTKPSFTQECETYGCQMGDISGNEQYDAARANWGVTWRLPTQIEMEELISCCDWKWVTKRVRGYIVTGPNGNSIFLPTTGYYIGDVLTDISYGHYWTSSPIDNYYDRDANGLYFKKDERNIIPFKRFWGQTIRPVSD